MKKLERSPSPHRAESPLTRTVRFEPLTSRTVTRPAEVDSTRTDRSVPTFHVDATLRAERVTVQEW